MAIHPLGQGYRVLGHEESCESSFSVCYGCKWGETCVDLRYPASSSTDSANPVTTEAEPQFPHVYQGC